jgi:hypothetical protein
MYSHAIQRSSFLTIMIMIDSSQANPMVGKYEGETR